MLTKRFRDKIVDFQVAKTALHLVRGDLLLLFSDTVVQTLINHTQVVYAISFGGF